MSNIFVKMHGTSDGHCPSCGSIMDQMQYGTMSSHNGTSQEIRKCKSCSAIYQYIPDSIKALAKETVLHGSPYGYTSATLSGTTVNSSTSSISLDYDTKNKFDNMSNNMSLMKASMETMQYTMQDLITEIHKLANQNADLIQKLESDQLKGLRQQVQEFNLK